MPIFGELELGAVAGALPQVRDLDTEAWELPKTEILQLACEIDDGSRTLLPRALHPAIPEYVTVLVARYPESPVGPFDLAQVRLMARAGVHPRGYVLGAVGSTDAAVTALRERWGFPVATGEIGLRRYHVAWSRLCVAPGRRSSRWPWSIRRSSRAATFSTSMRLRSPA